MLENISHEKLKSLDSAQLDELCAQIRRALVDSVSRTGGHLASNLGAVELTVALHRVYDPFKDRIIFDVGHQSYVHKMLTGRAEGLGSLRTYGGLSGFPKPTESQADAFISGHASNSVSAALGMARARSILDENYGVVAVIGDGALTGGLALEGLSDAGASGEPLVVVLNDNAMSIKGNVGGVSTHLSRQRVRPSYFKFKKFYRAFTKKIPGGKHLYNFTHRIKENIKRIVLSGGIFEGMGFQYMGPIDGHDVEKLTYMLTVARQLGKPVLLHVVTKKGKGYAPAESDPEKFHGIGAFNPDTGETAPRKETFSTAFGEAMEALAAQDSRICAITAAMQSGTGLEGFFEKFPSRAFDVGIAEEHAAVMAAAMAKQGALPVFAVYSTFLQRSYDMLLHDVAIDGIHAVFAVDRAGIVGEDGETHNGVFDVGFLNQIPGMTVYAPANYAELRAMLHRAIYDTAGPAAIRYPRGCQGDFTQDTSGEALACIKKGSDVNILTYGRMTDAALAAAELLEKESIGAGVLKLNVLTPLDIDGIDLSLPIVVAEECADAGSIGERLAARLGKKVTRINLGDGLVPHGKTGVLMEKYGLDAPGIARTVREALSGKGKT
ncbi:MAG: 1-deoxy-D-xylulose-5-phosphate synthase [Oscillospiraceae bacterium]|nr:1-deoxy-D-xylulose-5-phosphate synthase [Oscillospiraceae bacterium]